MTHFMAEIEGRGGEYLVEGVRDEIPFKSGRIWWRFRRRERGRRRPWKEQRREEEAELRRAEGPRPRVAAMSRCVAPRYKALWSDV